MAKAPPELSQAELDRIISHFSDAINIVWQGEDRRSIKRKIVERFGSYEVGMSGEIELVSEQGQNVSDSVLTSIAGNLSKRLQGLDRWKHLADQDRQAYRKQLNAFLTSIRVVLNRHCGIESHRPRKTNKDVGLIVELVRGPKKRTFGEVALEFQKTTGRKIKPGLVERRYKRFCEEEVDKLIDKFRPDLSLGPIMETFGMKFIRPEFPPIQDAVTIRVRRQIRG